MENIFKYILVLCFISKPISSQISTFSNPVLDIATTDAVVFRSYENYYLVYANSENELQILKSSFLTDFRTAEESVVYRYSGLHSGFHPSSFQECQNDLYLYFDVETTSKPWQTFVIKAHDATNPMGRWSAPVRVLGGIWNDTAVHGTPLQISNQLYFVWSSFANSAPKLLYIAKMKNPSEVLEPVILLREAVEDWECVLQGPSFLYNREIVYMVITSCTQNTTTGASLSYMTINVGSDPMIPSNWNIEVGSAFSGNEEENVYDPRNSKFTTSPDGTETWMLYTASNNISNLRPSSRIRIEKVEWNKTDGSPIFPVAKENGYQQALPSGEAAKYRNPVSGDFVPFYPNAHRVGNAYYTVSRSGRQLLLLMSDKLFDYSNAETSVVYTAAEGLSIASGRIFEIDGETLLYFNTYNNDQGYLFYVMKAENKSDLLQNWGAPTWLEGKQGWHPTVLQQNNQNYFVWGNYTSSGVGIYISPMRSPTEIVETMVLLREPKQAWECIEGCYAGYPSILYHNDVAFMIFGGTSGEYADSSLSYMSIDNGRDPMVVTNWYAAPYPVFTRNDAENVYETGRAWFTTSPDGLEDWMIYQASDNETDMGANRNIRIQKISWDPDTGHPLFPTARELSHLHAVPSIFKYFSNPITDDASSSPGVLRVGDFYYMLVTSDGSKELELIKSGKLVDFREADRKTVFSVPDGYSISGSSKMHTVDNQLYIYFSMEGTNSTSKLFVLQARDPNNPMGVWDTNPIHLAPSWDYPAFHSTILKHDENLYLVWVSPHPATDFNSIFIAQMKNATHVVEPVNLIRHPMELWECDGVCSNEAPYFIYNEGTAYMVHSVGSACKGGNALTYMSIDKSKDPMNIVSWNKSPGKVFSENRDENVLCPAHATFTVSPNQKETWMVYHATDSQHPDAVRTARIEKITWDQSTGEPTFPEPHGFYHQQLIPSRK